MRFAFSSAVAVVLVALCAVPASAQAARSTPGLVLATDGRYATCDVLLFSPDGAQLLACGDDKIVRRWIVENAGFSQRKLDPLRWPIFREQRGSLFAMAFSPDAKLIAVGGFGHLTGNVLVLDRATGDVKHARPGILSRYPTWAIAFSPSGKHVVYGTDVGEVFVWDLTKKEVRQLSDTGGTRVNRVRRIAFLSDKKDETRFVSIDQNGSIVIGDVRPDAQPKTLETSFGLPRLYQVAIDPSRRWLAAVPEGDQKGKDDNFERVVLLDLGKALDGKEERRSLKIPVGEDEFRVPHCLAFDHAGERLAVGCRVHPDTETGFYREVGGLLFVFDLKTDKQLPAVLDVGYRPDAVAFRPTPKGSPAAWKNQLATAGGNNHEVRLWDVSQKGKQLDVIQSPGSCLWSVALSKPQKDGKPRYLAWKETRAEKPTHPNRWGAGEWRVFDLSKKSVLTKKPDDFEPVAPIEQVRPTGAAQAWRVVTTKNAYVWRVVGPGDTDVALNTDELYQHAINELPRCYTFLPYTDKTGKQPVYLAVGHNWGVSIYQCRPGEVRLWRLMVGHESEVMAVAPSADGKTLVTASRDQTLAGWSTVPWPTGTELGASFAKKDNKLVVAEVSPGSPAWEANDPVTGGENENCRLVAGNVIDFLVITSKHQGQFVYDPADKRADYTKRFQMRIEKAKKLTLDQTLARLRDVRPVDELLFFKNVDGKEYVKKTTARQRPLWRFYVERQNSKAGGRDWIMWRWRDFYYDTNSARAEQYVGWQVNNGRAGKPDFFPLERFRGTDGKAGFNQPAKVWALFGSRADAEKVIFPEVQPPDVKLSVVTTPTKDRDGVLSLVVRPRDRLVGQKLAGSINLWVNDSKYPLELKPDKDGIVTEAKLPLSRQRLRNGKNVITVQASNVAGGRGQDSRTVEFTGGSDPTLYALCVGINDYSKVKGYEFADLRCSKNDAEEMARVFAQQAGSKLYKKAVVKLIPESKATADEIVKQITALGKQAKAGDWFVVFLSGHGSADEDKAGSFFFLCADTDRAKPATHLSSKKLYDALTAVPCSKMLILDCCHSGDVASNPTRDLSREGVRPLILSSCKGDQTSLEPRKGKHGLFTQSLLDAVGDAASADKKKRERAVRIGELETAILRRLPQLLLKYKVDPEDQVPEIYVPAELTGEAVLCGP